MGDDHNTVGDAFDKFLDRRNSRAAWITIAVSMLYIAFHFLPWAVSRFKIIGE